MNEDETLTDSAAAADVDLANGAFADELGDFAVDGRGRVEQRLHMTDRHQRRQIQAEIQHLCDASGIHTGAFLGDGSPHLALDVEDCLCDVAEVEVGGEGLDEAGVVEVVVEEIFFCFVVVGFILFWGFGCWDGCFAGAATGEGFATGEVRVGCCEGGRVAFEGGWFGGLFDAGVG